MIRDGNLQEMLREGAAVMMPGSEQLVVTHGMEGYPFPQQVLDDLASGALRIPDHYIGVLGVEIPGVHVDGKEIPMGQSVVLTFLKDVPIGKPEENQEKILPMIITTIGNMVANVLNQASSMPWLVQVAGHKIVTRLMDVCAEVSLEFQRMAAENPEMRGEPSVGEKVN